MQTRFCASSLPSIRLPTLARLRDRAMTSALANLIRRRHDGPLLLNGPHLLLEQPNRFTAVEEGPCQTEPTVGVGSPIASQKDGNFAPAYQAFHDPELPQRRLQYDFVWFTLGGLLLVVPGEELIEPTSLVSGIHEHLSLVRDL